MTNNTLSSAEKSKIAIALTEQGITKLCSFVRAPTNQKVKDAVFGALMSNKLPDYDQMDRNLKKYVLASYSLFQRKLTLLMDIKNILPISQVNEDYIKLVTGLYQRSLPENSINILIAVLVHDKSQIEAGESYNVPQSNVSRITTKFADVEAQAKEAIALLVMQ